MYHLNEPRTIKMYDEAGRKQNDLFTSIDKDTLMKVLLKKFEAYCSEIVEVSENKYKIRARFADINNNVAEFDLTLK